jgi:uncharacterized protein
MDEPLTLQSLPLFPLSAVLFPQGVLPLRIFEVRYLDMIKRCHGAAAPFGVVALTEGSEVRRPEQQERFHEVGTLARIDELSQPQSGLLHIRCSGLQRFRIQRSERLKHGLWVADVTHLPDDHDVGIPADLQATADMLGQLMDRLRAQLDPGEQLPFPTDTHLDAAGWVANRWCELLPLPVPLKQRLMELQNPLVRLELINDFLNRQQIAQPRPDQPEGGKPTGPA